MHYSGPWLHIRKAISIVQHKPCNTSPPMGLQVIHHPVVMQPPPPQSDFMSCVSAALPRWSPPTCARTSLCYMRHYRTLVSRAKNINHSRKDVFSPQNWFKKCLFEIMVLCFLLRSFLRMCISRCAQNKSAVRSLALSKCNCSQVDLYYIPVCFPDQAVGAAPAICSTLQIITKDHHFCAGHRGASLCWLYSTLQCSSNSHQKTHPTLLQMTGLFAVSWHDTFGLTPKKKKKNLPSDNARGPISWYRSPPTKAATRSSACSHICFGCLAERNVRTDVWKKND